MQLNITIAAIGSCYLSNRYTGSVVIEHNPMTPEAREERLAYNIETITQRVCVEP